MLLASSTPAADLSWRTKPSALALYTATQPFPHPPRPHPLAPPLLPLHPPPPPCLCIPLPDCYVRRFNIGYPPSPRDLPPYRHRHPFRSVSRFASLLLSSKKEESPPRRRDCWLEREALVRSASGTLRCTNYASSRSRCVLPYSMRSSQATAIPVYRTDQALPFHTTLDNAQLHAFPPSPTRSLHAARDSISSIDDGLYPFPSDTPIYFSRPGHFSPHSDQPGRSADQVRRENRSLLEQPATHVLGPDSDEDAEGEESDISSVLVVEGSHFEVPRADIERVRDAASDEGHSSAEAHSSEGEVQFARISRSQQGACLVDPSIIPIGDFGQRQRPTSFADQASTPYRLPPILISPFISPYESAPTLPAYLSSRPLYSAQVSPSDSLSPREENALDDRLRLALGASQNEKLSRLFALPPSSPSSPSPHTHQSIYYDPPSSPFLSKPRPLSLPFSHHAKASVSSPLITNDSLPFANHPNSIPPSFTRTTQILFPRLPTQPHTPSPSQSSPSTIRLVTSQTKPSSRLTSTNMLSGLFSHNLFGGGSGEEETSSGHRSSNSWGSSLPSPRTPLMSQIQSSVSFVPFLQFPWASS
jgi:hypothetical protein